MYTFFNGAKIISGVKALDNIPFELDFRKAKSPLLITNDITRDLGYLKIVLNSFDGSELKIPRIYSKVGDKLDVKVVEKLLNLYKENNCDSIIAVGDDVVMNVAKAVKLLLHQNITSFNQIKTGVDVKDTVTLVTVPTFLGSTHEATSSAEIFDISKNEVYDLQSKNLLPNLVVIDTRMSEVIPAVQLLEHGFFIISKALATYMYEQKDIMRKTYARVAFKNTISTLNDVVFNAKKVKHHLKIMEASVYQGLAVDLNQIELHDIISKKISRMYKIPYKLIYPIIFFEFFQREKDRIDEDMAELLVEIIGLDEYLKTPKEDRVETFHQKVLAYYNEKKQLADIPLLLRDFHISRTDFSKIAETTLFDPDKNLAGKFNFQDVMDILNAVY